MPEFDSYFPTVHTISGVQIAGGRVDTIEGGDYVSRVPAVGFEVRIPLRKMARRLEVSGYRLGSEGHRALRQLQQRTQISGVRVDGVEIGAFLSRIKKVAKKAVTATVKVAKKVADSKVAKGLYAAAKAVAPSPISNAIAATEMGVRLGKAVAKGNPKAKAAKAVSEKLAAGKLTPAQVNAEAKRLGVKPETIKGGAFLITAHNAPPGSPAKKVLNTAKAIEATAKGQTQKAPTKAPQGKEYTIPIKGKKYTMVLKAVA